MQSLRNLLTPNKIEYKINVKKAPIGVFLCSRNKEKTYYFKKRNSMV